MGKVSEAGEESPFKKRNTDFPRGPVVRTPGFQCRGHGFDPWSGKFCMPCSQEKKKKKEREKESAVSLPFQVKVIFASASATTAQCKVVWTVQSRMSEGKKKKRMSEGRRAEV